MRVLALILTCLLASCSLGTELGGFTPGQTDDDVMGAPDVQGDSTPDTREDDVPADMPPDTPDPPDAPADVPDHTEDAPDARDTPPGCDEFCAEVPGTYVDSCEDESCVWACQDRLVDLDDDLDRGPDGTGCECDTSTLEVCGDGVDNDCDGNTDEGCCDAEGWLSIPIPTDAIATSPTLAWSDGAMFAAWQLDRETGSQVQAALVLRDSLQRVDLPLVRDGGEARSPTATYHQERFYLGWLEGDGDDGDALTIQSHHTLNGALSTRPQPFSSSTSGTPLYSARISSVGRALAAAWVQPNHASDHPNRCNNSGELDAQCVRFEVRDLDVDTVDNEGPNAKLSRPRMAHTGASAVVIYIETDADREMEMSFMTFDEDVDELSEASVSRDLTDVDSTPDALALTDGIYLTAFYDVEAQMISLQALPVQEEVRHILLGNSGARDPRFAGRSLRNSVSLVWRDTGRLTHVALGDNLLPGEETLLRRFGSPVTQHDVAYGESGDFGVIAVTGSAILVGKFNARGLPLCGQ